MSLSRLGSKHVATVAPDCLVAEAARLMTMFSVGALVIAEDSHAKPQGIITDRDLVKMIGEGLDPKIATVACFAGSVVETAPVGSPIETLVEHMRKAGVRRLPLVDGDGRLVDLVSLDDLLVRMGSTMGQVAEAIALEFQHENPVPASAHERTL